MTSITRIEVRLNTQDATDDTVYLGLGGREFRLDTTANDHEGGFQRFILGRGANVTSDARNDPRDPPLDDVTDLDPFPVYIRKTGTRRGGGDDAWKIEFVEVTVNPGSNQKRFRRLFGRDKTLWLSNESGQTIHVPRG